MTGRRLIISIFLFCGVMARAESFRWWPEQTMPEGLVTVETADMQPVTEPCGKAVASLNMGQEHMLMQSLAGLAAQAVNEGRGDELIYVNLWDNADYNLWRNRVLKHTGIEDRGVSKPWKLVERYAEQGIVKGYILYAWDFSEGDITTRRADSDESCNVATSLAGLLGGIVISEGQEAQAKALGLKCLIDVRGKTEQWLFEKYADQLNRNYVLLQDPVVPNNRAIAIAHCIITVYGFEAPTEQVFQTLEKPSLVFGWNDGRKEGESVSQFSKYGHVIAPSNWALNLPVLSLLKDGEALLSFRRFDPTTIDFEDGSPSVSFYMSDGDNVQWMLGGFTHNRFYWASRLNGVYPLGWGAPLADLIQVGVEPYRYLQETQPDNTGMVLMPGYFFPDELGRALPKDQRAEVFEKYSARMEHYLKASGAGILSFLCMDYDSPEALEAYAIFAKGIPSLTGMMVIDYSPYEEGDGQVFWCPNAEGIDIPVISAKYSLWANQNHERSGTPTKVARLINEDALASEDPFCAWTIIHAWSGFHENWTADENEESGPYGRDGTKAGVAPAYWCVKRLDPSIKVITPDEMVWRTRMIHRPEQTRSILGLKK